MLRLLFPAGATGTSGTFLERQEKLNIFNLLLFNRFSVFFRGFRGRLYIDV